MSLCFIDALTIAQADLHALAKLATACVLGGAIGMQREVTHHPAGLRTHILVSLGCASFMLAGFYVAKAFPGGDIIGPGQALQGAITGMGFIGAGAIMKEGPNVHGITTAASLWVAGGVGILCATGAFVLALGTTAVAFIALVLSRPQPQSDKPEEQDR